MIPLFWPPKQNVKRMIAELKDTLSGQWWAQGPKVDLFEKKFGEKFGFEYVTMVNSGTAALHLAYVLAGIKAGDEVIVPVLTCSATCHPLKSMGAKIVFADVRPDTLTIDPVDVFKKITHRTKAIVVVHLGGMVTDRVSIKSIAKGIPLIEDACQALGNGDVGFGDFTCFSFQAIKALSTGDGGALICRRKKDHVRAQRLRWFDIDRKQKAKKNWQAWDRRGITFDQVEVGYKYQMNDVAASIGLAALDDFDCNLQRRSGLVDLYRKHLTGVSGIELLSDEWPTSNWLFMIKVKKRRDDLADHLRKNGIETNVAHIRNDLFTVFGGKRERLANMNAVEKEYLCLPLNDRTTVTQVLFICSIISNWGMK
ncbi:MAG: DegT/DnrJ/EryC1/StrS family aminotransferase [Sphaerochaeta sp.]|nr:DegT/DnrJ/EryC1/StrS family aminotransferase [Sphaerochaeta sp.]